MKKTLLSLLFCTTLFSNLHADGKIGLGIAYDYGFGIGAQFNHRLNLMAGQEGIVGDYLFFKHSVKNAFNFYAGVGLAFLWLRHTNEELLLDARLPLGIEVDLGKKVDFYLQVSPTVRIQEPISFYFRASGGLRFFF